MGACTSSTNKKTEIIDKGTHLDFESFRERIRKDQTNSQIFEVKAKLWEVQEIKNKVKKSLISKFLFFKPNGTFESRIMKGADEIWLEGKLESKGEIKLSYRQRMIDQNITLVKQFEGRVRFHENGELSTSGQIIELEPNKDSIRLETLLLDFSNTMWKVEYTVKNSAKNFKVFLYYKNGIFSGISFDEKGFSLWAGIEKNENKVTLVQQYLDSQNTQNSDSGIYSYSGIFDKIDFLIEGTVTSQEFESAATFSIKKMGKLNKLSTNIKSK